MSGAPPVTFTLEADGVAWIVFNDPVARANVLNPVTQAALAAAVDRIADPAVKAVVIASKKERIFVAGADLGWLASFADAGSAAEFARHGQRLFERLETAKTPVVCAIGGACVGGGFELALACHWRIASDTPATRIGLPETSLGTIPGWGGCVRLSRLIGPGPALDHILKARPLPAAEALNAGLIDEEVPTAELHDRARAMALRLASDGRPQRQTPAATRDEVFEEKRQAVLARTGTHQPALLAAIDVVEQISLSSLRRAGAVPPATSDRPRAASEAMASSSAQPVRMPQALDAAGPGAADELFEVEARAFGDVTAGAACKAMIHAFRVREAAKKRTLAGWFPPSGGSVAPIERVGVVGAGVMGSGLAQLLALHGHTVVVRELDTAALSRGLDLTRSLMDEAIKRGRISSDERSAALARIRGAAEWSDLAECDLVIEAVVEDVAIKRRVFQELARVVRSDALLASNTSALPIEDIAGELAQPGRALGLHFFNPVSRMSLVELVIGSQTNANTAERALNFLKRLGKLPVICRSSPGFLVTRVLFFYLNAAVKRWEHGTPAEVIDAALRDFGWPMGPMRLIDEVGLDVTQAIFGELARCFPGRFTASTACARLLAAGFRGRKNGTSAGFYRYDGPRERLNEEAARRIVGPNGSGAAGDIELVSSLMGVMAEEAWRCLDEGVVKSPDDIDFALLNGAGFPVFRGGLCRYARQPIASSSHVFQRITKQPSTELAPNSGGTL